MSSGNDVHLHRYKTMPGILWADRDVDRKWIRDFNTRPETNKNRSKSQKHKFFGSGKILLSEHDSLLTWLSTYDRGICLIDEVNDE